MKLEKEIIDISVIIPIYNVEMYLEECLNSILNQNFKGNYEIIAINDGSTDSSYSILMNYKKIYNSLITVINQPNKGLAESRNVGLSLARGEYIYFIDSDDFIRADTLSLCYKEAKKESLDCIIFDAEVVSEDNCYINERYDRRGMVESKVCSGLEFMNKYYKKDLYKCPVWLHFYKRNFLVGNDIEFTNGILHEDIDFSFNVMIKAKRIKYIEEFLFYRRVRENSIMTSGIGSTNIKSLLIAYENCIRLMNNSGEIDSKYIAILKRYIFDSYYRLFSYINDWDNERKREYIEQIFFSFLKCYYEILDSDFTEQDICYLYKFLIKGKELFSHNKQQDINKLYIDYLNKLYGNENFYCYLFEYVNRLRCKYVDIKNSEEINVGIYGVGEHSEELLKYLKSKFNIAQIYFIDSFKKSYDEQFIGKDIINITDIKKINIDYILLSSYGSEDIMYENLKKNKIPNSKIIRFYDKCDGILF